MEKSILSHIDFQVNKYKNKLQNKKCKPLLNKADNNICMIRQRIIYPLYVKGFMLLLYLKNLEL